MSSTLFEVMFNDQVEENEMDGVCSAYGEDKRRIQGFGGET